VAYTAVATVADGDDIIEDWGNDVAAAVDELQTEVPQGDFQALDAAVSQVRSTWSSSVASGITSGNGTFVASYSQVGVMTFAYFKFTLGSTSAITGDIILTLPVTTANQRFSGAGYFEDATGSRYPIAVSQIGSNTQVILRPITTGSTYAESATACSATVPFTWATGDIIVANMWYFDV
jgi:hypothetical protein